MDECIVSVNIKESLSDPLCRSAKVWKQDQGNYEDDFNYCPGHPGGAHAANEGGFPAPNIGRG